MQRIGIISAPSSTLNKRQPTLSLDLKKIVAHRGLLFVTSDMDQLSSALREFLKCGVDVIAVNGGDGTISRVITGAHGIWPVGTLPAFVPLRGGNFNNLAENLGIKGHPTQVLERLLNVLDTSENRSVRGLYSLDVDGQIGFLFSNGSASRFLEFFYRQKGGRLKCAATLFAIHAGSRFSKTAEFWKMVQADPTVVETEKGVVYAKPCLSVFCSTFQHAPYGAKLFPVTGPDCRAFQCMAFECQAKDVLVKGILEACLRPSRSPHRTSFCLREAAITSQGNRPYSLDGELIVPDGEKVTVKLGPKLKFLAV